MKKIDRLILKSFIGPLALTFVLSVFVLLMQFVWKYIDDMVGKGLDFGVIAELLLYASATFVPMALPIAVLFASIMTMGNFGEKYELIAMKAGGISIRRAMLPLTVVVLLLTGVAFYFANNVMPTAMLRYRMTLYDITRKKPAVNIRPGEYYKEIDGYVIHVGSKHSDGRTLQDIIIYDHSNGINETNAIFAKRGVMQTTPDNQYLLFSLEDGYTYTEPSNGENYTKRPLTTIKFHEQTITFDISSFAYNKSGEDLFKGSYQMMNINQLNQSIIRLDSGLNQHYADNLRDISGSLMAWHHYLKAAPPKASTQPTDVHKMISRMDPSDIKKAYRHASHLGRSTRGAFKTQSEILQSEREYINRHEIEKQRKFTLSIACLLLFLIGAPFGSIVRKGGLGLPLVASVGFFVLYYVIGMISEKAVRESALGPEGMWISSLVMLPIGLLLTIQATTDAPFFDASEWKKFFQKIFRPKKKSPPSAPPNTPVQ